MELIAWEVFVIFGVAALAQLARLAPAPIHDLLVRAIIYLGFGLILHRCATAAASDERVALVVTLQVLANGYIYWCCFDTGLLKGRTPQRLREVARVGTGLAALACGVFGVLQALSLIRAQRVAPVLELISNGATVLMGAGVALHMTRVVLELRLREGQPGGP